MALDGIFVHHLVNELNKTLNKSRLESISQYDDAFYLSFYKEKNKYNLMIQMHASQSAMFLTSTPYKKSEPNTFLSTLRKHLEGAILQDISQVLTDRIFVCRFKVYDFIEGPIEKILLFEAMGRHANLYLLKNQTIIDVYKKRFVTDGRHLIPGAIFDPFLTDKKDASTYQFDATESPKEITEKYLGISMRLATYLSQHPIKPLSIDVNPCYDKKNNKAYFFNIFEHDDVIYKETLSVVLDMRKGHVKVFKNPYLIFIQKELDKRKKKRISFEKQYHQAQIDLSYKDLADYIYQSGKDLSLKLKSVDHVMLDDEKTLNQNAQKYYKKYHKSKRALIHLDNLIKKLDEQIALLEQYTLEIPWHNPDELWHFDAILVPFGYKASTKKTPKNKKISKISLTKIVDEDATYYIGKNAIQNNYLTHEMAQKQDTWFHVKDASGSHVVLQAITLNETVIRKAAMLAAYFSALKHSSSIPVVYTQIKWVQKISGSLGHRVKYKNEATIYIDIDEKAIESWLSSRKD